MIARFSACAFALAVLLGTPAAQSEDANPRWDFLRMNLRTFPGADQIFQSDPELFWRLRPNLKKVRVAEKLPGRELPFRVSTDAKGRRRTPDAPADAPSILFLGDSCTFGIPVDDGSTFPSQVGELLGVRTINAGTPGYSAFQGRVLLDAIYERPKVVVITFWVNGRTSWDHLSDAEHLELLTAEREGDFSRHRITRLLRRVTPGARPRLNEAEFAEELTKMISRSRRIGATPLLVVWPTDQQMRGDGEEHPRQRIIKTVARDTGAAVVDLAEPFRVSGGGRLFVDPVHATVRGYGVAAKAIAEALQPLIDQ